MKVKSLSHVRLLATHGLQPTRPLHPWDFPGKSTGVGCHCLLHMDQHSTVNIKPGSFFFFFLMVREVQLNKKEKRQTFTPIWKPTTRAEDMTKEVILTTKFYKLENRLVIIDLGFGNFHSIQFLIIRDVWKPWKFSS